MKKVSILFTFCIVFSLNIIANEVIKITWAGGGGIQKLFVITATYNKDYTIDWGDGTVETKKGTGGEQIITYYYDSFDSFQVTIAGNSTDCLFTGLGCGGNRVSDLDLSKCTALTFLSCKMNQLSALDVSNCTALKELTCFDNRLSSLDLSANTALTHVWCFENRLSSLDVSGCTALIQLSCSDNQLSNLDLSANIVLETLGCANNRLSSLDFGNNLHLTGFACENNQITNLDLSSNPLIDRVDCYNNRLPLSDLYKISKKISDPFYRFLGTQTLTVQTILPGSSVDFSEQAEFDGIATVFEVQKDGFPATIDVDYTITAGIITFNHDGNYTVTMTNSAIVANAYYPAKVIAAFIVGEVGITDVNQVPEVLIYPNPTTNVVYIKAEKELIPEVKLYSTDGRLLQVVRSVEIDLSGYAAGVYYLRVEEKIMKLIKK
ncbi:MAG: T9SS type A sorting domain-containing protein [Bacteroidales bacterium]|nr:T9SS type A sorting domain-containing protein [Bacteroidales bacterium]